MDVERSYDLRNYKLRRWSRVREGESNVVGSLQVTINRQTGPCIIDSF